MRQKKGSILGGIPTGREWDDCKDLVIGDNFELGQNSIVMLGLEGATEIGNNVKTGSQVTIGHDSKISDNAMISSHTMIGGFASVGKNSVIALGCVIRNRAKVGNGSYIGMGSNVVKDIPDNVIAYGNPCKVISTRRKYLSFLLRHLT